MSFYQSRYYINAKADEALRSSQSELDELRTRVERLERLISAHERSERAGA